MSWCIANPRGSGIQHMKKTIIAAASAAILLASANAACAQQGATLAGPAEGSKADGSSSMQPPIASGATSGPMKHSGGAMTGLRGSGAPGAPSGKAGTGFGATTTR